MKGKRLWWILPVTAVVLIAAFVTVRRSVVWYSDLNPWDAGYGYVRDLVRDGIMEPRGEDYFGCAETVQVEEVMTLILRATGWEETPLEQQAVERKLVYTFEGVNEKRTCTRLFAAQMAARALQLVPLGVDSPYTDCDDGYVARLWKQGIWDCGSRFYPEEALTRLELAQLLWGMVYRDHTRDLFRYSNYWIGVLEDVPPYSYDSSRFSWEDGRPTYTGENIEVLRGVDVSGYQKDIDWAAVKEDGMDFAIVRAGGRFMQSGELFDDSKFEANMEGALKAGLKVGAYVFSQAITVEEALEEADYLLSRVEGYEITMPLVIDWEYLGGSTARTYGVEAEQITDAIEAFCRRVESAGYEPMVYFNSYCGYIKMDLSRLTGYSFWFAQYSVVPTFRYDFQMWQFSETGRVDGISTDVDMNLYFRKR